MRPILTLPHCRRPARYWLEVLADLLVCSRGDRYVEPLRHHAYGQPRRAHSRFCRLEEPRP